MENTNHPKLAPQKNLLNKWMNNAEQTENEDSNNQYKLAFRGRQSHFIKEIIKSRNLLFKTLALANLSNNLRRLRVWF